MPKLRRHTTYGEPERNRRSKGVRPGEVGLICVVAAIVLAVFAYRNVPFESPVDEHVAPDASAQAAVAAPEGAAEGDAVVKAGEETGDGVQETESAPARTPSGMAVPEEAIPEVKAEHEAGVVLISLEPGYTAEELTAAINASGCTVPQAITAEDIAAGFVTLTVADGYDVEHAMVQLGMLPETSGAQPNYLYHLTDDGLEEGAGALKDVLPDMSLTASAGAQATTINDTYRNEQWMLESIDAYEGWDIKKTEKAVTVAVVDNGCLVDHVDLKENIAASYNAVSDEPITAGAHGTHVCGIVAAEANNGKGVAGVSYNAKLLPIQVFKGATASSEDIAKAYTYIMEHAGEYNIKVVNMSLGSTMGKSLADADLDADDNLLIDKVGAAHRAGILTVCSAGNDAFNMDGAYINYPSDFLDSSLGVIALSDNSGIERAYYSNYNMQGQNTKDISAPGTSILSTYGSSTASYARSSGTSMASPCVAGVAALVYAADPSLTADQVADILCRSAVKVGGRSLYDENGFSLVYGYGEVNAQTALQLTTENFFFRGDSALLVGGSSQFVPVGAGGVTWTSSDSAVASVSADGGVTGCAPGTATITAEVGDKSFSKTVTVYSVIFDVAESVAVGDVVPVTFSHEPIRGTWTFGCSNEQAATLCAYDDATLGVYGVSPGTATISATLAANADVVVSRTVTVVPADIGKASVSAIADQAFTGGAIAPEPTITFKDEVLKKGVDYTLSYSNNANLGTAEIAIAGKGRFTGTKTVTFKIVAAPLANAMISGLGNVAYTGGAIAPNPTVKIGSRTLRAGTDYTVSYKNNVNVGTATVTVTGKGGYTGSKSATFRIVAASLAGASISGVGNATYTGGAIAPNPTVKIGSRTLRAGTDYTVSYKNNVNVGTATVTVTGRGSYTGSKSATFRITAYPVSKLSVACATWAYYTGRNITPGITVKLGSRTLKAGTDYTVSYAGNRNLGTATVAITGKGNFAGTVKRTFKIVRSPSYAGATSMPVSSTCTWTLSNCSLKVISGNAVSISGATVTARRAGVARIGIYNAAGALVGQKTVSVYNLSGATRTIQSAVSRSYVLDVSGGSKRNGANIQVYRSNGTAAQKFKFTLQSDGTYRIACVRSGRVIDVSGGSKRNGANVQQYGWNGTNAQRWYITVDANNRVTFINKGSNRVLDLSGGRAGNGRNIWQYTSNGTNAQKWYLA